MTQQDDKIILPRQFFRVARIIPPDQEVLGISPGTKVRAALELMSGRGFSQLPVMAGGTVIGVFTYRSLAQHLENVRRQDDPLDMAVDELLEDLSFVRPGADIGEVMHLIDRDDAILVGDEQRLLAVATAADVTQFLWQTTRPFIIIRDIELAIRDLMHHACPSVDELSGRIASALSKPQEKGAAKILEDLTLGQIILVLINTDNFGQCFRAAFGGNRDLVRSKLDSTCSIRNKVFHFLGDISPDEMEVLLTTWRWLERKILTVGPHI